MAFSALPHYSLQFYFQRFGFILYFANLRLVVRQTPPHLLLPKPQGHDKVSPPEVSFCCLATTKKKKKGEINK